MFGPWFLFSLPSFNKNSTELYCLYSFYDFRKISSSFVVGSKDWIGSVEVGLVLDQYCGVPCRILHCRSGKDLANIFHQVLKHFEERSCPIMMGGDMDNSSKGIFGACSTETEKYFLILDPHFVKRSDEEYCAENLVESGWAKWVRLEDFCDSSFYNLCLPQTRRQVQSWQACISISEPMSSTHNHCSSRYHIIIKLCAIKYFLSIIHATKPWNECQ